jgi:hypothetical protein
MKRGIFLRLRWRGCDFVKLFLFIGVCWLLLIYGFLKNSPEKSEQVADQYKIEKNLERLEEVKEQNLIENSENFIEEPEVLIKPESLVQKHETKHKVEVIEADFDDIKQNLIRRFENASNFKNTENVVEENLWTFQQPPNIFNNNSVGEYSIPWKLPISLPENIKKIVDEGWKTHQFNQYMSDLISVRRNLNDYRGDECRIMEKKYTKNLPATSVIMYIC